MSRTAAAWPSGGGVELRVRVTPKAGRSDVDRRPTDTARGPAYPVRVRAAPEDGEANAAVIDVVADWLRVPSSRISLKAGHTSRIKTLSVSGDPQSLLASLFADGPPPADNHPGPRPAGP